MLIQRLKQNLSNALVLSIQTQSFHWNVRGMLFSQTHEFFSEIYSSLYDMVDPLAEYIRMEGVMAPMSLPDIYKDKTITELNYIPGSASEMMTVLLDQNNVMLNSMYELMAESDSVKNYGLSDWVSAKIDMLKKFNWQLKAHLEL